MKARPRSDSPFVSVEHLSKEYAPAASARARRFFARFKGLQLDDDLLSDAMEDDDEDYHHDDEEHIADRNGLGRQVLEDVTFEARSGARLALVGPAGSGKTLLLKLIAGIIPPTNGRVRIRGVVAPALGMLAGTMPKGHTLESALPHMGAIAGLSPALVRSRLDLIADLTELPQFRRTLASALDSARKNELILATMLSVDPDILLSDLPIPRTEFGERCLVRLDQLLRQGTVLIAEGRDVRKILPIPNRVVQLDHGRIAADTAYAPRPPKAARVKAPRAKDPPPVEGSRPERPV